MDRTMGRNSKPLLVLTTALLVFAISFIAHDAAYAEDAPSESQAPQSAAQTEQKSAPANTAKPKASSFKAVPSGRYIAVTAKSAKVYSSADSTKDNVARWKFGTKAKAVAKAKDWYKVKKGDKVFYVEKENSVLYSPNKKHCAITFDDGPNCIVTPKILKALKKHGATATFFVVGERITPTSGKILKQAVKQGCEIGSHTYSHANLSTLPLERIEPQINHTDAKVEKYTGKITTVLRPPYSKYTRTALEIAGKPCILWSFESLDWKDKNAKRLVSRVSDNAKDGSIVIMHDVQPTTAKAINTILKKMKKKNFEMVTVTQLAAIKGKPLQPGKTYSFIR